MFAKVGLVVFGFIIVGLLVVIITGPGTSEDLVDLERRVEAVEEDRRSEEFRRPGLGSDPYEPFQGMREWQEQFRMERELERARNCDGNSTSIIPCN